VSRNHQQRDGAAVHQQALSVCRLAASLH
jgi:hypothetical protein